MSRLCQEDLATALDRLREAGLITSQTFSRWSRMLAAGLVEFVRARGDYFILFNVLKYFLLPYE